MVYFKQNLINTFFSQKAGLIIINHTPQRTHHSICSLTNVCFSLESINQVANGEKYQEEAFWEIYEPVGSR